ncbi:putative RNA-directed DNA polymerase from transposon X-element [Stylophora pistillata]|uniref:Putative RNA-directed DNA polymerase from transposon X-element n=1 Tax=Stylophora pistillata TaxID=50429 RepID=A0A2B4RE30_STYPI|nr:putative RNA-directed DNA polymerase from transposon X-element [Stylophora pistillata]
MARKRQPLTQFTWVVTSPSPRKRLCRKLLNGNVNDGKRPISLLYIISKVLERCVLNRINDRLEDLIANCQPGFRSGHSCVTNLLETLDHIGAILDRAVQVDCVYLDASKAFDKVRHDILMEKLRDAGFGGNLLTWFRAYLCDRRQRVTVLGTTSRDLPVTSGVPQGSILGPALFLLYVNKLPDSILNSKVAMFADDPKVYKAVMSEDDGASLQQDLDNLSSGSISSGLAFND